MRPYVVIGLLLLGLLLFGRVERAVDATSTLDSAATRNAAISQALMAHPVHTLVGDYWRIVSSNQQSPSPQTVAPLRDCLSASPRSIDFEHRSFAYLLSTDMANGGLENCSSEAIVATFGQPTAITVIAGSNEQPKEQLLFYDDGAQPPRKQPKVSANDEFQAASGNSLKPVDVRKAAHQTCAGHRTILQVAAHEDDDLLFMNPDLLHAIRQGDCVRTVYMTAGDAGSSKFYWLGRERGSQAAYSLLSGAHDVWVGQTLKLGTHRFASAASPVGSNQLSLLFLHLPDGKPDGQGFAVSNFDSLAKLVSGEKTNIQSVDGQSIYSYDNLLDALQTLMDVYQPDEVRTQRPISDSVAFTDHSDHLTVGQLTATAFKNYQVKKPGVRLSYYAGYPVRENPQNVVGEDLLLKEQAFFTYANFDGAVCSSMEACLASGVYGEYLPRQYRYEP